MTETGCGRPKHHCKVKQNVITMENAGGYYPAFRHKHNAPIDRKSLSVAAALTSSKKSARILVCCPFRYLRLWNCPSELNGQRRSLTQNIHHLQAGASHVSLKEICTYPHKTSTAVSFPTPNEIFQISDSQEQASINAFSIICLQPAPDPYRASAAICVANL